MATAHVLVGQCGTQLGHAFLDALADEAAQTSSEDYARAISARHYRQPLSTSKSSSSRLRPQAASTQGRPEARCILIDMEPKVIQQALHPQVGTSNVDGDGKEVEAEEEDARHHTPLYRLSEAQCVSRHEGCGNNWALGYLHQGPSRREAMEECLRRESEGRGRALTTYHVIHSVAGGTGSGVGSLVSEVIKEHYPHTSLLHTVVWPFRTGEVATQWYNLVLTLSSLRDSADAVLLLPNDGVAKQVLASRPSHNNSSGSAAAVSFGDLNRAMAQLMMPLHLPQLLCELPVYASAATGATTSTGRRSTGAHNNNAHSPPVLREVCTEDLLEAVCLDPAAKFFAAKRIPWSGSGAGVEPSPSGQSWPAVLEQAMRVAAHNMDVESAVFAGVQAGGAVAFTSRTCLWALRGPAARRDGLAHLQRLLNQGSTTAANCTGLWVSGAEEEEKVGATTARHPKEVHLYGASTQIGHELEHALKRAEELLSARAYLHHFSKYGVDQEWIGSSIASLWDSAASYQ